MAEEAVAKRKTSSPARNLINPGYPAHSSSTTQEIAC